MLVPALTVHWLDYRDSQRLTATARQTIVEVGRVRVDVIRLSYDGGLVRATLLQSASADVALDG